MISFVVCSVSAEKLDNFRANIDKTIGTEYEIVVVDNRSAGYSLCQAYNIGAARAKYPYLCFAHEDIEFLSDNWATPIIEQLEKLDTGVIGFAGATGKPRTLCTWSFLHRYHRLNMRETYQGVSRDTLLNPRDEKFSQVIVLDGLCMFVRADVWREVRFDEATFDGFHLYDLDFSTAVAVAGYRNYVCHTVMVEHFSRGSFDRVWMGYSKKYHDKWANMLPLYVEAQSAKEIRRVERSTHRRMCQFIVNRQLLDVEQMKQMAQKTIRDFPFRPDSYFLWAKLKKYQKKFARSK